MEADKKFNVPPPLPAYSAPEPQHPAPPGPIQHQPVQMVTMPTVTVTPGMIIGGPQMGSHPSSVTCRSCNMQITTQTKAKASTKTHLIALVLCLIGCWPCVCIPYCKDSCRNIEHYCPNCEAYIGSNRGL